MDCSGIVISGCENPLVGGLPNAAVLLLFHQKAIRVSLARIGVEVQAPGKNICHLIRQLGPLACFFDTLNQRALQRPANADRTDRSGDTGIRYDGWGCDISRRLALTS